MYATRGRKDIFVPGDFRITIEPGCRDLGTELQKKRLQKKLSLEIAADLSGGNRAGGGIGRNTLWSLEKRTVHGLYDLKNLDAQCFLNLLYHAYGCTPAEIETFLDLYICNLWRQMAARQAQEYHDLYEVMLALPSTLADFLDRNGRW